MGVVKIEHVECFKTIRRIDNEKCIHIVLQWARIYILLYLRPNDQKNHIFDVPLCGVIVLLHFHAYRFSIFHTMWSLETVYLCNLDRILRDRAGRKNHSKNQNMFSSEDGIIEKTRQVITEPICYNFTKNIPTSIDLRRSTPSKLVHLEAQKTTNTTTIVL